MTLKGVMTIELTDADTGTVETVTEENMITESVNNILGLNPIGNGSALRTAVIFFYLANEGISVLENSAVIGLPVPEKLKEMLLRLTEEEHSQGGGDVDPPIGESTDDDSREM